MGVIATKATVESDAYTKAIRHLDAGITVFSTATPRFVEIAEQGLRMAEGPIEDFTSLVSTVYIRPAFQEIAREYLEPLRRCDIDTLVLGCTHFPLLKALIGGVVGRDVTLISSAQEAAHDVAHILSRRGALASEEHEPSYDFYTGRTWRNSAASARACSAPTSTGSDASRSPRNATVQGEGASPYEDYRHRQQQRAQG